MALISRLKILKTHEGLLSEESPAIVSRIVDRDLVNDEGRTTTDLPRSQKCWQVLGLAKVM